jgi:hypothetical protein
MGRACFHSTRPSSTTASREQRNNNKKEFAQSIPLPPPTLCFVGLRGAFKGLTTVTLRGTQGTTARTEPLSTWRPSNLRRRWTALRQGHR